MPAQDTIQTPAKRQAILAAAGAVFAKHGFSGADTQRIADLADVGKGTVYRYFGNKQELFLATADAGMKQLEATIFGAIEGMDDPVKIIRTSARAYAGFFQRHPGFVEIMILERAEFRGSIPDTHLVYRAKNRDMFDEVIQRGVEQGVFRNVNARETINVLANLLYGTIVTGCIEGTSSELERMADLAVDIFFQGIMVGAPA